MQYFTQLLIWYSFVLQKPVNGFKSSTTSFPENGVNPKCLLFPMKSLSSDYENGQVICNIFVGKKISKKKSHNSIFKGNWKSQIWAGKKKSLYTAIIQKSLIDLKYFLQSSREIYSKEKTGTPTPNPSILNWILVDQDG